MRRIFILSQAMFLVLLFACNNSRGRGGEVPDSGLHERLLSLPGVTVKKIAPDSLFSEAYELRIEQPLDHQNPGGEKFTQRIYLSHRDFARPMVLVTEGYSAKKNYSLELSKILKANQIVVEHRYFGESRPDSLKWEYLNIRQAAEDHHRIVELFKPIYKGKWINTGISKGGQTAMFHRRFYPDDVEVSVCYVAPLNFAQEEPRIHRFLETVDGAECREKIKQFQRRVLKQRDQLLPLAKWYSKGKGYSYPMGLEMAFEYAVLEYSFAFWQWGASPCDSIPGEDASPDQLLDHLIKVAGFDLFSEADVKYYEPFQYQAYTEIGYYNYRTADFADLLKAAPPNASNRILAPQNVPLTFRPEVMRDVHEWIQTEGNNMLFIYGELDTWSASAVETGGKTNAVKVVQKGGSHKTRINTLPEPGRELALSTLEQWLDMKIERQPYQ